jgi:hypothetical protein
VLVTGYFRESADFGGTTLTSAGEYDVFVAKYDAAGNVLWAKSAGGESEVTAGSGVATDGLGNVFLTGAFGGSATFGDSTLTSAGDREVFVAKYHAFGNVLWAKSAGGVELDVGLGIATDVSGNVFLTGAIGDSATFGGTTLTSAGDRDVFVAKYDAFGNVLWAESAGGISIDDGYGVATDGSSNVLVTGYFEDSADFGGTTLTSAGYRAIFVIKMGPNGFE